jgi:hypothetical protein
MSAVQLIVKRVQILLEDLGSQWTDSDYIYGHLGILDVDIEQRLQNLGLNYNTFVVILPNIPANTTDLSAFQSIGNSKSRARLERGVLAGPVGVVCLEEAK